MVARTRMSEMFLGRLMHNSGVERLLNILLVSGSISACFVISSTLFSSRLNPFVLGVRVSLNTNGAGLLSCCVLWFCFEDALRSRSNLSVGVKYF